MTQSEAHSKRSSKFLKDLGIYAIGNLGSKIITFAMVPLYTFFIKETGDFGYYDLCFTMVLLLISPVTLQLRDGAFRFLIDNNDLETRKHTITFSYTTLLATTTVTFIITMFIYVFCDVKYIWLTFLLLVVMSFYEVVSQIARGLEHKQEFVVSSIISAFGIGIFSIIFVVVLSMGIMGIFWANILARFFALLFLEIKIGILKNYFDININYWALGKKILKYSLPLMPGIMCWWLASSCDRYFISYHLGVSVNGYYSVAVRFTGLIYTVTIIFYQAWQDTAITQYHSSDRDNYFSQMADTFIFFVSFLFINYIILLLILYPFIVDANYSASANCIYPLFLSAVMFSVAQFLDLGYQCSKDTARILPSYVLTALINVALNFFLIRRWGVTGALFTINVSYLFLMFYRIVDTRRYFKIKLNLKTLLPISLILLCAIPIYLSNSLFFSIFFLLFSDLILLLAMPSYVKNNLFGNLIKIKQ